MKGRANFLAVTEPRAQVRWKPTALVGLQSAERGAEACGIQGRAPLMNGSPVSILWQRLDVERGRGVRRAQRCIRAYSTHLGPALYHELGLQQADWG